MKRIGDKIILKPGSKSYKHFIDYMPIDGHIIKIDHNHYHGQSRRPYLIEFSDQRTGWYAAHEIVKVSESD